MNEFDIHEEQYVSAKERDFENALRPLAFEDFNGQQKIVENLKIFVEAAKMRGSLWTILSFTALQDWERLLWRLSLRTNWV